MLKSASNPGGLPIEVFDQLRSSVIADRSQFWKDLSTPFYGYNRPGAKISEGTDSALLSAKMVKNSELKIYRGAPHGMCTT
jgi:non-heme chloroperoxidase